ncbi:SirB2 family protein [Cocleimonas sp. KMM 6892]|uniref:SirB2 family protein n=1 Tax=unclassified Cocleimonas TaxID=2639732 RepID=UPI002DB83CDD|nr:MULTISPECIES: SirB2 family protein [unclassified Cocleimonas]MEB8431302.1 SirB2 family protein [Cocleimonas sp. KMM 6892]MEC4713926.1 SirB2 family protein [Cocleimonas sp. KMM 6895]MEC4743257.1 SirB2 family protein [Cocleimonas sp. KMM 6896]
MDLSLLIKAHSGIAIAVLIIYIVRGALMLANSPKTNSATVLSIASIFTLLLFGLGVYIGFAQNLSFADGFILTKIISLLLFVAFGTIALKKGLSKAVASGLWLLGLVAFIYAFLIATHKLAPLF